LSLFIRLFQRFILSLCPDEEIESPYTLKTVNL
jgi:hypothetical protein